MEKMVTLKIGYRQHHDMFIVDNMIYHQLLSIKVILSVLSNELTVTIVEMKE